MAQLKTSKQCFPSNKKCPDGRKEKHAPTLIDQVSQRTDSLIKTAIWQLKDQTA